MPHSDAGPRIDPPVQEPSAPRAWPDATDEPEPLLEPPVMCARFHGLQAGSKGVVQSGPPSANSCIASLPSRMPPAALSRAVVVASSVGTRSMSTREPEVVRTPAVSYRSFSAKGMPCMCPR